MNIQDSKYMCLDEVNNFHTLFPHFTPPFPLISSHATHMALQKIALVDSFLIYTMINSSV